MFGTARRSTMHAMGTSNPVFTPAWRVVAALVVAKGQDGRLRHLYRGDVCDWLSDEQAEHFVGRGLVERIDADSIAAAAHAPAESVDLDADEDAPDSGAVAECIETLARLQVPTTAGGPTARASLRGNGYRYGNSVIAEAVKRRRKSSLSGTAEDADDFEVVVA